MEAGQVSHSWLCNGVERHCAGALGIRPAANGRASLDDAGRCVDEIRENRVGAEPGPWRPWLLVEYS